MNKLNILYNNALENINKSARLLNSSLSKYKPYEYDREYSDDELEYYDALSDRFLRTIEMCTRLIKTWELLNFGTNSLSLRDTLNNAEKNNLIQSTSDWMEMKQLRNKIAHEYMPDEIGFYYSQIHEKYSNHISFFVDKINIVER